MNIRECKKENLGFLIWLSGIDKETLSKCTESKSAEINKYRQIGMLLLVSTFLAFFSSYVFIQDMIPNKEGYQKELISIIGGIFFATGMLSFDKFIISNYGNKNKAILIIRVILTLLIGFLVSKPLLMAFFNEDIQRIVIEKNQEEESIAKNNQTWIKLTEKKENLVKQLECYEAYKSFESNGEKPQDNGCSSIAQFSFSLKSSRAANYDLLNERANLIQSEIKVVENEINDLKQKIAQKLNHGDGILRRLNLFFEFLLKNPPAMLMASLVMLILITFDISPVMLKIFLPDGEYDLIKQDIAKRNEEWFCTNKKIYEEKERSRLQKEIIKSRIDDRLDVLEKIKTIKTEELSVILGTISNNEKDSAFLSGNIIGAIRPPRLPNPSRNTRYLPDPNKEIDEYILGILTAKGKPTGIEYIISNSSFCELDITKRLQSLLKRKMITKIGRGKKSLYIINNHIIK